MKCNPGNSLKFVFPVISLALLMLNNAVANEVSDGMGSVSYSEIRSALNSAPDKVRNSMSAAQMSLFISNMLVDKRLEAAARMSGVAELPEVKARIERAALDVVVRAFVDQESAKVSATLPDLTGLAMERYAVNKATYNLPEAIRVSHILFNVNPEKPEAADEAVRVKAESVLRKIQSGEDFAALAREYSEDKGSARTGGELPNWVEKGKLVPPFEAAAYALKPGEVSGLVRTRFGYHIIKLIDYRASTVRPFDEVKDQILESLRKELLAKKRQEWLKPYLGTQPIVLDEKAMELLKKP